MQDGDREPPEVPRQALRPQGDPPDGDAAAPQAGPGEERRPRRPRVLLGLSGAARSQSRDFTRLP